jgi:putative membrane protein
MGRDETVYARNPGDDEMKRDFLIGASVLVLALSACGHKGSADADMNASSAASSANAEDSNAATSVGAPPSAVAAQPAGQTFANTAAASDAFEIATSKLALDKAGKPAVRKFAQQMITAHTASTAKLKSVGGSLSPAITPDPTLSADQQQVLTDLQSKSAAEFDSAYKAAQVSGHQKTLDALKSYAASGDTPALKSFASGLVPTVTAHLNMAKSL